MSLINKYRLDKFLTAHAATVPVNSKTDVFIFIVFNNFNN